MLTTRILRGADDRGRLERPRYEARLKRRAQRPSGCRAEGRTGDVSGERAEPFTSEVAVIAGDIGSFLRHVSIGRPSRPASILSAASGTDNPRPEEFAANCTCCQQRRNACKISTLGQSLSTSATPVENSPQ